MRHPSRRALSGLLSLACACASTAASPARTRPAPAVGEEPAPGGSSPEEAAASKGATPDYAALVAAADRSEDDRALDAGRKPAETLAFFAVEPGMRVAEIAVGTGYTAELLARAVGDTGRVYGVNNRFVLERFAEAPWSARLSKPVMARVERLDREFDDPFPPELKDLDLVVNVLFYHDTVWMKSDRAAMNAAVFRALRSGGRYVVIDHEAAPGHGVRDAQTLHRIEASVVQAEIEAAGFRLARSGTFLQNPDDAHDWNASPRAAGDRRGTSDRFALEFVKP